MCLLTQLFGGKACILMRDEYDAAIYHSHSSLPNEVSGDVINIYRDINETTFKGNSYLEKGLITGVLE